MPKALSPLPERRGLKATLAPLLPSGEKGLGDVACFCVAVGGLKVAHQVFNATWVESSAKSALMQMAQYRLLDLLCVSFSGLVKK